MKRKEHIFISGRELKHCRRCGGLKPLDAFNKNRRLWDGLQHYCRSCANEMCRSAHVKASYGITDGQYDEMLRAQGGVCAICSQQCPTGQRLSVDHNHATGDVRALLCRRCNAALGLLDEDVDRIVALAAYVIQYSPKPKPVRS